MARALREDLVARFGKLYPSAVQCFEEDFEACIAHLRLPPNHRRATRTTNLLERLFVEERRRLRAVVHVFGERPVLKLMYRALVRRAERWRGVTITEFERLREEPQAEPRDRRAPAVAPRFTPSRLHREDPA